MAYVMEFDIDKFGYLMGGDEYFPADTAFHDWTRPYPRIPQQFTLSWVKGDEKAQPQIFAHNRLRDFVCDRATRHLMSSLAAGDMHVVAEATLDDRALTVIQAATVLDVVDTTKSTLSGTNPQQVAFPHIPQQADSAISRHLFRVPNPGLSLAVFAGDELKLALDDVGIQGVRFLRGETTTMLTIRILDAGSAASISTTHKAGEPVVQHQKARG